MKTFLLSKKFIMIMVLLVVLQLLMAYATFGPSVSMKVNGLPIGIVNTDREASGLNYGDKILNQITQNTAKEVKWVSYASEQELVKAMDDKSVYGGMVIPENVTASLLSLNASQPASIRMKLYINEGMSANGSKPAGTILTETVKGIARQMKDQVLAEKEKAGVKLAVPEVKALDGLIVPDTVTVHQAASTGDSQLPMLFTVLLWMGSLIGALMIWLSLHRENQTVKRFLSIQLAGGAAAAILQGISAVVIAKWLMRLNLVHYAILIPFIMLSAFMFFLIQSNVLNWLGFKGWPILILIWLFGTPLISLPPQFLSGFYRIGVYSWIPIRFNVEGFKSILFYNGHADFGAMLTVVACITAASLALILLSSVQLTKKDLTRNPMAARFQS